jgi:hypothetical protein
MRSPIQVLRRRLLAGVSAAIWSWALHCRLLYWPARLDPLIVDERAMAPRADGDRRNFLEISDDRCQTRSTLLTSQVPVPA